MYDAITVDGINEAGLTCSGLYLNEADYGVRDPRRPGISLTVTLQYFLDTFATVAEAVAWLAETNPQICPVLLGSSGQPGTGHISLADTSGDSAIIEYLAGVAHVHHGAQYTIMTNSPPFEQQLAGLSKYAGFGGSEPLPGTHESADRFVRAAYYAAHLPATADEREAVAYVLSVMRNTSQPFGTSDPARPNISATRWRTVADLTHRRYFWEQTTSPNIVWVALDELDFKAGARARKLDVATRPDRVGDVSRSFRPARPFRFLTPGGTAA
jgi:choloylglycine hydrolase